MLTQPTWPQLVMAMRIGAPDGVESWRNGADAAMSAMARTTSAGSSTNPRSTQAPGPMTSLSTLSFGLLRLAPVEMARQHHGVVYRRILCRIEQRGVAAM